MAYSTDYRKAAIDYKHSGHTFKELKKVFKITPRTFYKWLNNEETSGNVKAKIKRTRKRKIDSDALIKAVEEKPDSYLRELAKLFNCSTVAIHNRLVKLGYTYKKNIYIRRKINGSKSWLPQEIRNDSQGNTSLYRRKRHKQTAGARIWQGNSWCSHWGHKARKKISTDKCNRRKNRRQNCCALLLCRKHNKRVFRRMVSPEIH